MRRVLSGVIAAVAIVALSACSGLPTSGDVNAGREIGGDAEESDFAFLLPERPQPGASPTAIVEGFLRAGSGAADNWLRATDFLAPGASWDPTASVTIDVATDRQVVEVEEGTVRVSVVTVATVDDRGVYEPGDGGATQLTFEVAQQDDGEWRITEAPDGIVLDRNVFPNVFNRYPLMYFSATWDYLVPDLRWFPRTNTATRITDALVNEPRSEWLAFAVASAFPEEVTANASVPVSPFGVAEVTLSNEVLATDQGTRDRMLTQLSASLSAAGVSEVQMLVDTTPLEAEIVPTRRTTVTGPPLVRTEAGFGFLSGGDLSPIPGLSGQIVDLDARAIQVDPDRSAAAVRVADGSVLRVTAGESAPSTVDTRPDLVDPTIDPGGVVWTVPRDAPQAVRAELAGGGVVEVAGAWPDATQILGMAVSRDGTRMAALVTAGGRTSLWTAGIVRSADGIPQRLDPPQVLDLIDGTAFGLAWLDDVTVGVLARDTETAFVVEQLVGGPATVTLAPLDVVSIAGGNSTSSTRLLAGDGTLYIKRSANWQETASGILVLATQQGIPE
jgi:hypothetical protein